VFAGACRMNKHQIRDSVAQAARLNVVERAIAIVSPGTAARRMRARLSLSVGGYVGARWDRKATKSWHTPQGAADDVTLYDLPTLRDRSRDLLRNTPIARGAVSTVVSKVVGTGLRLQSRPDAKVLKLSDEQAAELGKSIEREFAYWAESTDCDITRTQNFAGLTELFFWSALESGDCFALTPMVKRPGAIYSTCLQIVESDRVCNPSNQLRDTATLRAGIEYDLHGAPIKYHVRRNHPGSLFGMGDTAEDVVDAFGKRTGRRNVIHGFRRERPGQTRGVPYLAPVIETIKQLTRYTDAEVDAAVLSAMFTVFITTPDGDGFSDSDGDTATEGSGKSGGIDAATEVKLGTGAIVDLMPGEKPEFANPSRPNAQFDPFMQACVRQVGLALGIPYEVLIKHFTASYSAARAALLEAWEFFKQRRAWLVSTFVQPAFECWFDEAVASGRISAPGYFSDPAMRRAYLNAEWHGPQPLSLDPEKDANAAKTRLEIGVSTRADETLNLTGKDYDEQHTQQVRERDMRARDGLTDAPATPVTGAPANQNKSNPDKPDKPDAPDTADQSEGN
jgi:lambda family phage portal protein